MKWTREKPTVRMCCEYHRLWCLDQRMPTTAPGTLLQWCGEPPTAADVLTADGLRREQEREIREALAALITGVMFGHMQQTWARVCQILRGAAERAGQNPPSWMSEPLPSSSEPTPPKPQND